MLNLKKSLNTINKYLVCKILTCLVVANSFTLSPIASQREVLSASVPHAVLDDGEIIKEIKKIAYLKNRNSTFRKLNYTIITTIILYIVISNFGPASLKKALSEKTKQLKNLLNRFFAVSNSEEVDQNQAELNSLKQESANMQQELEKLKEITWLQKKEINKLKVENEKNDQVFCALIDQLYNNNSSHQDNRNFIKIFFGKVGRIASGAKSIPGQTFRYLYSYVPFNGKISYVGSKISYLGGKISDGIKAAPGETFALTTSIVGHALFVFGPEFIFGKLLRNYNTYLQEIDFENYLQYHTKFYQSIDMLNACAVTDPEKSVSTDALYIELSKENLRLVYNQLIKESEKVIAYMLYAKLKNKHMGQITKSTIDKLVENFKNNLSDITNFIDSYNLGAIKNRSSAINNVSNLFISLEANYIK